MFAVSVFEVLEALGVLTAVSVSALSFRRAQQVRRAESDQLTVEAGSMAIDAVEQSLGVVAKLQRQVGELKEQFAALRRENQLLRAHNEMLSQQVRDRGGTPIPFETIASSWPLDD